MSKLAKLVADCITGWKPKHVIDRCDGTKAIRCGSCGGSGHGNCYGRGDGPVQVTCGPDWHCCESARMPEYDSHIADAWLVVEQVKLKHAQGRCAIEVARTAAGNPDYRYECMIAERIYDETGWSTNKHTFYANATNAPMAICIAALRAAGVSEAEIQEALK